MFDSIIKALGFAKPTRKKVQLPKGLNQLEVVSAKGWWN
jgi:hypothetical protein